MTAVNEQGATATFRCDVNHSVANTLRVFIQGDGLSARQMENDSCGAYLYNYSGQSNKPKSRFGLTGIN